MKERGIIFTGWSIPKIMDKTKTMTRRTWGLEFVNQDPDAFEFLRMEGDLAVFHELKNSRVITALPQLRSLPKKIEGAYPNLLFYIKCPYGQVGDRLWLKHRYDLFDVYYKPIEGWNGNYATGTDGHIYRMDGIEPYQLKECPTGDKGYLAVSLSMGSYKQTANVHRLICQAFYGYDDHQRTQVRHLDGNPENNRPSNLDWGTQEDNWLDRKYHGRGMGEQHHSSKLTIKQILEIRASSKSQRQLANLYGVSQQTIQGILSNKTWNDKQQQPPRNYPEWKGWRSPLFMPHWASRIDSEITNLRAERLQDISGLDCIREGLLGDEYRTAPQLIGEYAALWDSLNPRYPWAGNHWVWPIGFKLL